MGYNSFKNYVTDKSFTYKYIYIYIYINKQDLTLNNPQGLICHETPQNQTKLK